MTVDTLHRLQAGQLAGARALKLNAGLHHLPDAVFGLADTLEVLDLSGNHLSSLPSGLGRLRKLRVLFASGNPFTHLPEVLGDCPELEMVGFKGCQIRQVPAPALPAALRWLILTDNQIEALPDALGQRPRLQKLMLAGNRLAGLPTTLHQCHSLELLRISANRLAALPAWLPSLPRLTWLAFGGNPLTAAAEAQALRQAPTVDWAPLQLGEQLGEGASGQIHAATWQAPAQGAALPAALKLFKGQMTSDGLPRSEMAACLAAGSHPNLIGVHGLLQGHPDGREGLLMRRVSAQAQALAGPPSLQSCTRDVYPDGQRFTLAQVLQLAHGLASACAHLHGRGILHGDLYAHNLLWQAEGECLLGDFGAASFVPQADASTAQALMRLEVRALGCLLQELLSRLAPEAASAQPAAQAVATLQGLQAQCLDPHGAQRPLAHEVAQILAAEWARL